MMAAQRMMSMLKAHALSFNRSCDIITFEVSGKTSLEPRQACAVESAALHHPNRTVCLGMRAPLPLLKVWR